MKKKIVKKEIEREDFMKAFRDDEWLNTKLTPDDRLEIFASILIGSSDITKDLLDELLDNYGIDNIDIVEKEEE